MKVHVRKQTCGILVSGPINDPPDPVPNRSAALVPGRCAHLTCPYGMAIIVQGDGWSDFVIVQMTGWRMSEAFIDGVLQEIADNGVEFEDFEQFDTVAVTRDNPPIAELVACGVNPVDDTENQP